MMPSDLGDTERSLPRRDWNADPKCASPFCDQRIRVRGEFCKICEAQQQRHREAMRQYRQRQAQ
jgi:hypothetical protein